jgi:amino acid transporter
MVVGLAQFNNPGYVPERWHATLIMWGFTIFPFLGNFWLRKILNPLEAVGAIIHVVFFIVSIITLVVLAQRSTVEFVFHTLTHDISGWKEPAVAWGLGLLTVTYPLSGKYFIRTIYESILLIIVIGFDGVLHMSDEVKKARIRVPRSMITSVVLNAIMQFAFMITVLFTIGDVDLVSADPLPIIQVYYQATGSKAATNLFVSMILIVVFVSFFNVFASVSRLMWAFARDNGLPFSTFFAKVHPTLKMPLNALFLIGACICLLATINAGSSTAFNALISLPALGLYISYFFPIFFLFWRRLSRNHPTPIPWGPFKLGIYGPFINLGAMLYIIFIVIWMPFPAFLPVDGLTMNYSGPILAAVILGALADWVISGRKRFQIPVARHRPDFN